MDINHDNSSEGHLLSLAAKGDKKAFGRLYEQHLDEILRYVFYKVGDTHEAEDITEEVFLKTWRHLPELYEKRGRIDNFRAWVYRIAHNLVIDFYRARKPLSLKEDLIPVEENNPEVITENAFTSRRLAKAIMALQDNYQEIIILRFVNQLSHEEAALIMNLNRGHARVLQFRALKKLHSILTSQDGRDV
jgi:RNA polymerase sigma-70 factor (ECF subfamily)